MLTNDSEKAWLAPCPQSVPLRGLSFPAPRSRQWWTLSGFILDLHPDSMQDKKQQRMWLLHGFGPSEPVVLSPRCQAWHALMMVQCTFNRKNWYFFLQCLMEDSETHNNANHHWNILALLRRSKRKIRREEKKRKRKNQTNEREKEKDW